MSVRDYLTSQKQKRSFLNVKIFSKSEVDIQRPRIAKTQIDRSNYLMRLSRIFSSFQLGLSSSCSLKFMLSCKIKVEFNLSVFIWINVLGILCQSSEYIHETLNDTMAMHVCLLTTISICFNHHCIYFQTSHRSQSHCFEVWAKQ